MTRKSKQKKNDDEKKKSTRNYLKCYEKNVSLVVFNYIFSCGCCIVSDAVKIIQVATYRARALAAILNI